MKDNNLHNHIKSGLIQWLPFFQGGKAAIVSDNIDMSLPYVDVLEKADVNIDIVGLQDQLPANTYDYIVCIKDIEMTANPNTILEMFYYGLKKDGVLILGLNNRLGIRYFCGDHEIYSKEIFGGIDNYCNIKGKNGRCYSEVQIREMIADVGYEYCLIYSVMPSLEKPKIICADNFNPGESLGNRITPEYEQPEGVFLNEDEMYDDLVSEGLYHKLANAYLVIASNKMIELDVRKVNLSLDRMPNDEFITIITSNDRVKKIAVRPEGMKQLKQLNDNLISIEKRGIKVVKGRVEGNTYIMPYIKAPTGQQYLEKLLHDDLEKFLYYMDKFYYILLSSSDRMRTDSNLGDIYELVFPDMVPHNTFFIDGDFVFFDQEFVEREYPINVAVVRMIDSFYFGKPYLNSLYSGGLLHERYNVKKEYKELDRMQIGFLEKHIQNNNTESEKLDRNVILGEIFRNRNLLREIGTESMEYRLFLELLAKRKGIIIFGTGKYGEHFYTRFGKLSRIIAVVDNDPNKWGKEWHNYEIFPPEELKRFKNNGNVILICVKNNREIIRQLTNMWIFHFIIYHTIFEKKGKMENICTNNQMHYVGNSQEKEYHIGYVAGAFDMFHIGHINLLRRAKEKCDYLIVGVMSDEWMYKLKMKYPVIPCCERIQVLESCRYVDQVEELPVGAAGIMDAYNKFHYDCMFSGDDHIDNPFWIADREQLREKGSDIVFFPYTKETSSSEIKKKINNIGVEETE